MQSMTKTLKFYFIRHAHFVKQDDKHNLPFFKQHLSPLGWDQALELDYLLSQAGVSFSYIFCSPLARTRETIYPFSLRTGLDTIIYSDLKEFEVGDEVKYWEWKKTADMNFEFRAGKKGETRNSAFDRYSKVIDQIIDQVNDQTNIIISTHGIIMDNFFKGVGFDTKDFQYNHPSVFSLEYNYGEFVNLKKEDSLVPGNATLNTPEFSATHYYPVVKLDTDSQFVG
jgi:broad specificity phosphatase PhoE